MQTLQNDIYNCQAFSARIDIAKVTAEMWQKQIQEIEKWPNDLFFKKVNTNQAK